MKAAVYYETGAPEVLKYEDVAEPTLFADGLLIDVAAIAIQGGDTLNRLGGALASKPHIVGYQASGTVREVGANTKGFTPGQAVVATMGFGSHAEVICPWAVSTWPIPNGLSLQEAAGVPIEFGTADDCLFEFGHLKAGETVLIQAGASGVGIAAIQLAKAAGATVIATSSSDERLEKLKKYGLDHGINYTKVDCAKTVMELTNGAGVNLVLDSVGGATLESSIASLLSVIAALSWARLFFQSHSLLAAGFALVLATIFTIPLLVLAFRASPVLGIAFLPYQLWLAVATSLAFGFAAQ